MVPAGNAVAGLDLGERKQALVVMGLDGQVLARRSPQVTVIMGLLWPGNSKPMITSAGRGLVGLKRSEGLV